MQQRLDITGLAADAYKHMFGLEKFLNGSALPKTTRELVKLRASQLNGCAFCVDMHAHDLRGDGETDERLFGVVAWRETPFFTPEERAALALTEEATLLGREGVRDEVWDEARKHFDDEQLAALVVAIATINAWNRFGTILQLVPGSLRTS